MKLNKKLILLTSLVMMSLNVFSQNVTNTSSKDTTQIQITKPVARLVIKDLLKGDGFGKEIETMQLLLTETNNKLLTQTDLVTNLQFQINNYDSTILAMQQKYDTQARLSQELEVALKRSKRQAKLYKIGTYVGLGAIGILLVK